MGSNSPERAYHHLLALAGEEVLPLAILLQLASQLLPLIFELLLLLLRLQLQLPDLSLCAVALLIGDIRDLDYLCHPLLLLGKLMLQLLVDAVEDDAFAP